MNALNNPLIDGGRLPNQKGNRKSGWSGFFQWWYNLTSVPEPPADASFVKREAVRRSRLLSLVILFMLVAGVIFLPPALIPPIHPGTIAVMSLPPISLIAILLNRSQRVFAAGILLVITFELVFSMLVITTQPSDELSLGQYMLFVLVELVAVALLPPSSVFFVASYNIVFMIVSLLWLPHTLILTQAIQQRFATIVAKPLVIQLLVAVAGYIFVKSALHAIARADRAEMIAALEHQISQEKRHLEENINQIVQSYVDTMNNHIVTRIPFSEETKVLWPLINVIDSLQKRLRTAQQGEYESQRLKKAIAGYIDFIYKSQGVTPPQQWPRTETELDMLLHALKQQGYLSSHLAAKEGEH